MSFGIPVRNGLGVGLLASTSLATRNAFSPAALFAAGEQGAWYDPSDLTTMFQDSAGTTPVTATGQAVGRILDKSGRGNHATQATAASRPIYGIEPFGGRRNLLTYTEQFDNAAWTKADAIVSADSSAAPDGTNTADKLIPNVATLSGRIVQAFAGSIGATYTLSAYAKQAEFTNFRIYSDDGSANSASVSYNLATGAVTTAAAPTGTWTSVSATATSVGNGWWRFTLTWTATSAAPTRVALWCRDTGNGTSGIFIWGAQLEAGSFATAYQRVTDQWNVTQAGVPSVSYLAFDGTDDFLVTPTITPGTNAAQAFAGVRKLNDATTNVLFESSGVSTTNPGTIGIFAPSGAAANYNWRSQGSNTGISVSGVTFAAPITNVVTGIGDIAADTCILRVNGAQVGSTAADQGTGNYLAYPIYIGRRNGTSFPLNGRIYSLIIRFGANLTAGQISQTESWVNGKTGAY